MERSLSGPGGDPPGIAGLTRQQGACFAFLCLRDGEGKTPSFEEIAEHLGLASKSGVYRLLTALEERGRIRRHRYRARGIEIIQHACPHCGKPLPPKQDPTQQSPAARSA